ncbi:replication fork protection component Swi3-domain-containing protein [Pholiota molesta]|nr:replication fork protection component Swi3-domain-containing protein [Pholiota molesta]
MDSSLDSIWDEPAIENSPSGRIASKRPRSALFLSDADDSDEDVGPSRKPASHTAPPPQEVDMDALFAEFDDDDLALQPLPARIDEEAVARRAEARYRNMPGLTPHQIMPSSSPSRDVDERTTNGKTDKGDNEKKARRKILKLDESRLLGSNGFPELIKMTKDFKIKGKGHEATDLNRILQTYQYWAHQLYPKMQFHDTVERVEKLCHSRRMNVSLSVWRDEAHGIMNRRKDTDDEVDENEDGDNADHVEDTTMDTDDHLLRPRSSSSIPSSRASSPPATSGAESEVPLQPRVEAPKAPSQHGEEDDEEAFWRSLDEFGEESSGAHAPPPVPTAVPPAPMDDDDEMWDIINEVEQSTAQSSNRPPPPPAPSNPPSAIPAAAEDDWDDMYL